MSENKGNDSAFWGFVIDAAIVAAALALYSKTQEVMTALAPLTLFGQQGLSLIYGFGVAALIEGVTLALHFLRRFEGNQRAELYKWFLFGISTFCQFLDQSIVKDTANQSQMESFFAWVALGIVPAIFFGLLWVKGGSVDALRSRPPAQFVGVVPAFRRLWWGSGENTVSSRPTEPIKDVRQIKAKFNGNDLQEEEKVNPTIGKRS